MREVLEVVERDRLLPPLIVLQKLALNPHLQLATVRDYVARQIAQDTRAIEEDRRAIEKYKVGEGRGGNLIRVYVKGCGSFALIIVGCNVLVSVMRARTFSNLY